MGGDDGTGFHAERFSGLPLDEAWLARSCRTVWDQTSGRPKGVHVMGAPGGRLLVIKAGRRRALRRSRSRGAARVAAVLGAAGVLTPEVHAVCTQDGGEFEALVMGFVASVPFASSVTSAQAGACLDGMARSIAAMHGAGVRHRDLKGSNILLRFADGEYEAWIIDLDGARAMAFGVPFRARVRDLARAMLSLDVLGADDGALLELYAVHAGWSDAETARARLLSGGYKSRKRTQNARRGRELT